MISVVNMRCGSACLRVLFILKTAYSPTVLEKSFPTHVVCSGMGNSLQVARKHDLQTTEDHFKKTTQLSGALAHHAGAFDPEKAGSQKNAGGK